MADPNFTAACGGTNGRELNVSENVIRALTRITLKVRERIGDDAAREALDIAVTSLDDDPSVSDLEGIAEQVGVDISEYRDGSGDTAAASAVASAVANGSSSVSLTSNTRRVAEAHGLPTNWHALEGVDLPPSLADATLDDRGLAAAINKANGWDRDEGEGVTSRLVGRVRDKGGADRPGASVEELAGNDAGLDSDLDAEPPLPVSTVKQYVARHKRETGRAARQHTAESFGASIDDLD